ncbi:MAG: glycoside hydrolase family 31 protein [Chitinophagaceae bacterium]|nr:glycoside hydrolase family 31 protein [Chitinophagaceae bacterium]
MKKNIRYWMLCCLLFSTAALAQAQDKSKSTIIEHEFNKTSQIRVEAVSDAIIRISIVPKGTAFQHSGLNRYGFITPVVQPTTQPQVSKTSQGVTIKTGKLGLKINYSTGSIRVTEGNSDKVLLDQVSSGFKDGVSEAVFNAAKDEDWIGFGDQARTHLYHRGRIADCDIRYKTSTYIPVPFFMSTKGVGVVVNTTYRTIFDMCKTKPDSYNWINESGTIDYYLFVGKDYKQILDLYTSLTGRPKLPPHWAFGLWFICREQASDYEVIDCAVNLRREEIPCDVIGLEPGWMSKNYDYSVKKQWHPERFPHPWWFGDARPPSFVPPLKNMGYKLKLWLCMNYDLSYEAERQVGNNPTLAALAPADNANATSPVFFDPNLGRVVRSDTVTVIDEPWFKHLEKFVDQGVDMFKMDGSTQMDFHPDRLWGNGMKDKEMHNLYPLLYSQQMYDGFRKRTNRRPASLTPAGWVGYQAFSTVWTGDTGGELTTLGGVMNNSIVGHSWSTVDMEVFKREGIHYGYLLPISEICSWAYFKMPWIQGKELTDMHRYYAQLRSKLFPYLYSSANVATKTGWPVLQPLTLAYPEDKKNRDILHQYLLGPGLMVGIYKDSIYFPEGQWKDYWTGETVQGGQLKVVTWPKDRGGSLYVKSGAIIPMGPLMQYRGEKPMDEITLYVFPDEKESFFDLYEDDGVSFDYEKGRSMSTRIATKKAGNVNTVEIGKGVGGFEGAVKQRTWKVVMHLAAKPTSVAMNGVSLNESDYSYDDQRKELTVSKLSASGTLTVQGE